MTDAEIDRIADAVPVDRIGVHATTWHRRFARAVLAAHLARPEPVAYGMPRADGLILDVISPDARKVMEGEYTVPLYAAPPVAPAGMVMVEALRKARKALDGIDATACCDHWANMNSSARRYAIARDARAAVQDIDRVVLAAAPAPAVPLTDERVAFEAWMRASVAKNAKPGDFDGMGEFWFDKTDDGAYEVMRIQDAWTAWQARAHGIGGGGNV